MIKWAPSNGSEGTAFVESFCANCHRDKAYREGRGDSCPILAASMLYDRDDDEYPAEWIEDGEPPAPRCTAFEDVAKPRPVKILIGQLGLFK